MRHHTQQIAARHRRGRQLEQREHGLADPTAIIDRRIDQVTRHADCFECRWRLREVPLASPATTPRSRARSARDPHRAGAAPRRRSPRSRGAGSGMRAPSRPRLDPRARRDPRPDIRKQVLSRGVATVGDERGIEVTARSLDERTQRVAHRAAHSTRGSGSLGSGAPLAAAPRPATSSHSSSHGSRMYAVTSVVAARSVSASSWRGTETTARTARPAPRPRGAEDPHAGEPTAASGRARTCDREPPARGA